MVTHDPGRLLLPEGTRLVHIGPPKTGTTAVQSAFHSGRAAIAAAGVHYAGPNRQPVNPVLAVTRRVDPLTGKPPPMRRWRDLVREVERAKEPRSVISSEFLTQADPEAIHKVVDDLGQGRMHIVVTLRPLTKIIPSQWQQYVQSGMRAPFESWLQSVFHKPESKDAQRFWYRHRHDELIARWAEAAGPENVTVVALGDGDPSTVLRVFEELVGLPDGLLVADPDLENRSMTLPEVEVVRAFNRLFDTEDLGGPLHHTVMRFGAALYMKERKPEPDETRIAVPQWALDEATGIARSMVDAIAASGVRTVGDMDALARPTSGGAADGGQPVPVITPEIAARAAVGVLIAGGLGRGTSTPVARPSRRATLEPPEIVRVSTTRLIGVVVQRGLARVRDQGDRIARRLGRAD